jgi:hypothetical protein
MSRLFPGGDATCCADGNNLFRIAVERDGRRSSSG